MRFELRYTSFKFYYAGSEIRSGSWSPVYVSASATYLVRSPSSSVQAGREVLRSVSPSVFEPTGRLSIFRMSRVDPFHCPMSWYPFEIFEPTADVISPIMLGSYTMSSSSWSFRFFSTFYLRNKVVVNNTLARNNYSATSIQRFNRKHLRGTATATVAPGL